MEKIKSYKIYGLVSCGYCRRLVEKLRALKIPFYAEFLEKQDNTYWLNKALKYAYRYDTLDIFKTIL